MANSSDWIAALAERKAGVENPADNGAGETPDRTPAWIAALGAREDFRPGMPFAQTPARPPDPAPEEALAAALAEARAEGEAAGRAAARAEMEIEDDHRRTVRLAFRSLDAAALDALAADLAETVIALCSEAIAGWTPEPDALAERCREAAQRLGGAPDTLALHLHPADIETLGADAFQGWKVVPDPALERGALQLEGAAGTLTDGPEDWRRAIAEAVRG